MNLFSYYLLFVCLGIIANKYRSSYYLIIEKGGYYWLLMFISTMFINVFFTIDKLYMGLCSIPAIHYLALSTKGRVGQITAKIGTFSYYIYLMNSVVTATFYYLIVVIFEFEVSYSFLCFLLLVGVFMPIIIYKYVIENIPFLNKIIR